MIIKVNPINYNLKSNLEKETIISSYKNFLKSCNFDIQIIIQSKKEDLTKYLSEIEKNYLQDNKNIKNLINQYKNELKKINIKSKSNSKQFYIIIKQFSDNKNLDINREELMEKYFKIKDLLQKCGNTVEVINDKKTIVEILKSIFVKNNNLDF